MQQLSPPLVLASVYDNDEPTRSFLYRELYYLLGERPANANISHKEMPSWQQHVSFVESKPYKEWYIIQNEGSQCMGAFYVTHKNEIGIAIFERFKRQGLARKILKYLIETNPGVVFYANINPDNSPSINLFTGMGFKKIQHTYAFTP